MGLIDLEITESNAVRILLESRLVFVASSFNQYMVDSHEFHFGSEKLNNFFIYVKLYYTRMSLVTIFKKN